MNGNALSQKLSIEFFIFSLAQYQFRMGGYNRPRPYTIDNEWLVTIVV